MRYQRKTALFVLGFALIGMLASSAGALELWGQRYYVVNRCLECEDPLLYVKTPPAASPAVKDIDPEKREREDLHADKGEDLLRGIRVEDLVPKDLGDKMASILDEPWGSPVPYFQARADADDIDADYNKDEMMYRLVARGDYWIEFDASALAALPKNLEVTLTTGQYDVTITHGSRQIKATFKQIGSTTAYAATSFTNADGVTYTIAYGGGDYSKPLSITGDSGRLVFNYDGTGKFIDSVFQVQDVDDADGDGNTTEYLSAERTELEHVVADANTHAGTYFITQIPTGFVENPGDSDVDDIKITYARYVDNGTPSVRRVEMMLEPAWFARLAKDSDNLSLADMKTYLNDIDLTAESVVIGGESKVKDYLCRLAEFDEDGELTKVNVKANVCDTTGADSRKVSYEPSATYNSTRGAMLNDPNHWDSKEVVQYKDSAGVLIGEITTYRNRLGQILLRVNEEGPGLSVTDDPIYRRGEYRFYKGHPMVYPPTVDMGDRVFVFENNVIDWDAIDDDIAGDLTCWQDVVEQYDDLMGCMGYAQLTFLYLNQTGTTHVYGYYSYTLASSSTPGAVENELAYHAVYDNRPTYPDNLVSGTRYEYFLHTPTGEPSRAYLGKKWDMVTELPVALRSVRYTEYAYTFHGNDEVESRTQTRYVDDFELHMMIWWDTMGWGYVDPPDLTATNSLTSTSFYDDDGQLTWHRDEIGNISYNEYNSLGRRIKRIEEVDTSGGSGFSDLPDGWATPSFGGLHQISDYTYDLSGMLIESLGPDHPVMVGDGDDQILIRTARWNVLIENGPFDLDQHWRASGYKVVDDNDVTGYADGDWDLVGPITVEKRCKLARAMQTIMLGKSGWNDSTGDVDDRLDADDTLAVTGADTSDWVGYSTLTFDFDGHVDWRRAYHDIPASITSSVYGSQGINYLETDYEYDGLGRRIATSVAAADWTATDDNLNQSITTYGYHEAASGDVYKETRQYRVHLDADTTDVYTMTAPVSIQWVNTDGELFRRSTAEVTLSGKPAGTESIASNMELTRMEYTYDSSGRRLQTRVYETLPDNWTTAGTPSQYNVISDTDVDGDGFADVDLLGRQLRIKDASGNITARVYDALGRVQRVYVGTDATGAVRRDPAAGSGNMMMVSENFYDYARGGQGTATQVPFVTRINALRSADVTDSDGDGIFDTVVGSSDSAYVSTDYKPYDSGVGGKVVILALTDDIVHPFRLSEVLLPSGTIQYSIKDGLGTGYSQPYLATTPLAPITGRRLDLGGRLAASVTMKITVSPNDPYIDTRYKYDEAGRRVATIAPAGGMSKNLYTGAGRLLSRYVATDEDVSQTIGQEEVSGDIVIEEVQYEYGLAGNVVRQITHRREDNAPETTVGLLSLDGEDEGEAYDDYMDNTVIRQSSYVDYYYDIAGQQACVVNHGVSATAPTRGPAAPNKPDASTDPYVYDGSMIVSWTDYEYAYDFSAEATSPDGAPDGRMIEMTGNDGVKARGYYDRLGRQTYLVENYDNFHLHPSTDAPTNTGGATGVEDRATAYTYNAGGQTLTLTALDTTGDGSTTTGDDQTTKYIYAGQLAASEVDEAVKRNHLLKYIIYPDSAESLQGNGTMTTTGDDGGTSDHDESDYVKLAYYGSGALGMREDQRGVELQYEYDEMDRLLTVGLPTNTSDVPTEDFPTGVDDSVERIAYTYDSLGALVNADSLANTSSTWSTVNGVKRTYGTWRKLAAEYQDHGAVATTADPNVAYTYDVPTGSGRSALDLRLTQVSYDFRISSETELKKDQFYLYGAADSIADVLSRVDSIYDAADDTITTPVKATNPHTEYRYLGTATFVGVQRGLAGAHGFELTYGTVADDDTAAYSGFDRFGRVTGQLWATTPVPGEPTTLDEFSYGYDASGNREYRLNVEAASQSVDLDELNAYDDLSRLTQNDRGDVTVSGTPGASTMAAPDRRELFTLDQVGNWDQHEIKTEQSGLTTTDLQTRDHNAANEIEDDDDGDALAIDVTVPSDAGSDWPDPTYDAAGNMTEVMSGKSLAQFTAVYDAFNRLVALKDASADTIVTYEYDAFNRRIEQTPGPADGFSVPRRRFWYNPAWQLVQVDELATTPDPDEWYVVEQYVWDMRYIDAPIYRLRDTTANGGETDNVLDEQLYCLNDANMNVTAVVDPDAANPASLVVERYAYDPYGQLIVLDADFTLDSGNESDVDNQILFAGYHHDPQTGFYLARNRYHHPRLGRWITRDPAGYVDGMSLYQYVMSRPLYYTDPMGMDVADNTNRDDPLFKHIADPLADAAMAASLTATAEYDCQLPQYDIESSKNPDDKKQRLYNKYDANFVAAVAWWVSEEGLDQTALNDEDCICKLAAVLKAMAFQESYVGYGSGFRNPPEQQGGYRYPQQNTTPSGKKDPWIDTEDVMQVGDPGDLLPHQKLAEINTAYGKSIEGTPEGLSFKNITGQQSIFYGAGWLLHKMEDGCNCSDKTIQDGIQGYGPGPEKYAKSVWTLYTTGAYGDRTIFEVEAEDEDEAEDEK